jgi:putative pyruvate formate lyase activating enzyme
VEVIQRNLLAARESADMIVRLLLMPGHEACCRAPILEWLAREMPDTKVSLRSNYVPPAGALRAPATFLKRSEVDRAMEQASMLNLKLVS